MTTQMLLNNQHLDKLVRSVFCFLFFSFACNVPSELKRVVTLVYTKNMDTTRLYNEETMVWVETLGTIKLLQVY